MLYQTATITTWVNVEQRIIVFSFTSSQLVSRHSTLVRSSTGDERCLTLEDDPVKGGKIKEERKNRLPRFGQEWVGQKCNFNLRRWPAYGQEFFGERGKEAIRAFYLPILYFCSFFPSSSLFCLPLSLSLLHDDKRTNERAHERTTINSPLLTAWSSFAYHY
jgi:hypothetical protein